MLCDECQKNLASVHLTKIVNDSMAKMHLCEECAGHLGGAAAAQALAALPQILAGLFDLEPSIPTAPIFEGDVLQCTECGSSFNDLRQTGKLGCPSCYEAFEEKLAPVLRRIHGSVEHTGKFPAGAADSVGRRLELRRLSELLAEQVGREAYEEAAVTRDLIRGLEIEAEQVE